MIDLESRIEEIKSNLVSKNFKYIIKCKYKTIPAKEKDIYKLPPYSRELSAKAILNYQRQSNH